MGPQSTDKVPGLRRLTRRVASPLAMRPSWLWMFLDFCFLAAMAAAPAQLTGGPGHGTAPAVKLPHTLVAADVARIPQSRAPGIPQQIVFDQPPDTTVGQPPVALAASSVTAASQPIGTGLLVSFRSDTPAVCTVSDSALTPASPGTCVITSFQDGDGTYAPAPDVAHASQVQAGKATQQISFGMPANMIVGETVRLQAKTQVRPAIFRSDTPAVCIVSGPDLTPVAPGTCVVTASQGGNESFASADMAATSQVRGGDTTQNISFTLPAEMTAGEMVTLSAPTTSGLTATFRSDTPQVCRVSGSIVTPATPGLCVITAVQGGSADFAPAHDVAAASQVRGGPTPQDISFTPPAGMTVGEPVTLSASASSGLAVSFRSDTPAACTVSSRTVIPLAPGTCEITASQGGSGGYAPVSRVYSSPVTSGQRPQDIAFPFKLTQDPWVGAVLTLTASASSGLAVSFQSDAPAVCAVSRRTVILLAPGSCRLTAYQGGSAGYAPAHAPVREPVTFQVFEGKAGQTILFDPLPAATAGMPFTLWATASSGLSVVFGSDSPTVCTVSSRTVIPLTTGTCTITAVQGGSAEFASASSPQSVQVGPAPQSIDFPQPPAITYGQSQTLTATASSGLPVAFTSGSADVCSTSGTNGSTVTAIKTGTCAITATQPGDTNHNPAEPATRQFAIGRAAQAIDFPQPADIVFGKPATLSAKASSGQRVSFSTGSPDVCTVSGATVTPTAVGPCRITASQAGNPRYAPARTVARSFQVGRAPQTITFTPPDGATVGQPVTLSASASSGLTVTYRTDSSSVCTVSGATVAPATAGTCTITASQAGNDTYLAADDVPQSFPVHPGAGHHGPKVSQSITFAQPAGTTAGQTVPLDAAATSGLAVSFRSDTPSVCTVSGVTVTTTVAGTCAVTASQPGDDHFAAARDMQRSFAVQARPGHDHKTHGTKTHGTKTHGTNSNGPPTAGQKASQAIAFGQPPAAAVGQVVPLSASTTSGLEVSFSSDTPRTCTISGSTVSPAAAGTCTVTASQAGSDRYAAARDVKQSFQVAAAASILPNALIFLLGAAVLAVAGVTALVRRVRRPRRPPPPQPTLRAAPDPGPPTLVSIQNTGAGVPHTVRLEPSPGASIITIKEAKP